ncbi:hypothetical protein N7G274_007536 [Stereocaulon virgatum]|uniref:Uncharacterized protein n=1 Tax=Stereocaulon virgatum TaxID=373712 RepID=A0ABR4A5J6_9LECA
MLHPKEDGSVQDHIEQQILDDHDSMANWFHLHLTIFSWYLPGWRQYIRHLGVRLDKAIDFALTFDMSQSSDMESDPGRLQQLQHLHDEIISMIAWLKTSLKIILELQKLNLQFSQDLSEDQKWSNATQISYQIDTINAYSDSAELMKERVLSILQLIEVGIQQDNHKLNLTLNRGMLGLAEATAIDNVTIKAVTLVTLIFLPANLVAVILSTQFFSSNNGFTVSPKFWIFFAISVPLTVFTVGAWIMYSRAHGKSRQRIKLMV